MDNSDSVPLDHRAYRFALRKRDGGEVSERLVRAITRIRLHSDVVRIRGITTWNLLFRIERDLVLILHLHGVHEHAHTHHFWPGTPRPFATDGASPLRELLLEDRPNKLAIAAIQALWALRKMIRWYIRQKCGPHSARLALWQVAFYAFRYAAYIEDAIEASMDFSAVEAADRLTNVRPRRWKGQKKLYDLIQNEYKEQSTLHPEWPSWKLQKQVARAPRVQERADQLGIAVVPRTVRSALSQNQKV